MSNSLHNILTGSAGFLKERTANTILGTAALSVLIPIAIAACSGGTGAVPANTTAPPTRAPVAMQTAAPTPVNVYVDDLASPVRAVSGSWNSEENSFNYRLTVPLTGNKEFANVTAIASLDKTVLAEIAGVTINPNESYDATFNVLLPPGQQEVNFSFISPNNEVLGNYDTIVDVPPTPTFRTPTPKPTKAPTVAPTPPLSTPIPTVKPTPLPFASDLAPHTPTGWTGPVTLFENDGTLLTNSTDYKQGREVGYSLTNTGNKTARDFNVALYVNGERSKIIPVEELKPGNSITGKVSLDELIIRHKLKSTDQNTFGIYVDFENKIPELDKDEEANTYTTEGIQIKVAKDPTPRREPESAKEAEIQTAFDNFTWYTQANVSELTAIAKEVLKDVPLDWSKVKVSILPVEEFNQSYDDVFGDARGAPKESLRGFGYLTGTTALQEVYLREGIISQTLPSLIRELGSAPYAQTNINGLISAASVNGASGGTELDQALLESYGLSVLNEKFNWSSLTAASIYAGNDTTILRTITDSGMRGMEVRSLWALANREGYENGKVPSDVWLRLYTDLIQMPDPTAYLLELGTEANNLETASVSDIIKSNIFVDKEETILPKDIQRKLDPNNIFSDSLSLDRITINQNSTTYPVNYDVD